MWKLKARVPMVDYKGVVKFYRVDIPGDAIDHSHFRGSIGKFINEYKKWARENCADTWVVSELESHCDWKKAKDPVYWFYIGFASGEDKLMFHLAHDPKEVIMYRKGLMAFVREKA